MTETGRRYIDLSHEIVDGMTTHPGIPPPSISTFLSYEDQPPATPPARHSRSAGSTSSPTPARTSTRRPTGSPGGGTRPISPSRRSPTCPESSSTAAPATDRAIGPDAFEGIELAGLAVLVRTGWDRHWGTPAYLVGHPFLTGAAAERLVAAGVAAVGIDSLNVDSLEDPSRPAHTAILGAGLPLIEHLTGLGGLPTGRFRFFAVPPRVRGMATFPVRAFAILGED